MTATEIGWTEWTWNPTTGCDRISPGCDNQADGDPRTSGPGFGMTIHPGVIEEPLRWRTPRLVFVNSMSDIGHARIPRAALARIWAVMALTGRHRYQVLTKRPKRLATVLGDPQFVARIAVEATDIIRAMPAHLGRRRLDLGGCRLAGDSGRGPGWTVSETAAGNLRVPPWPLPNVWVGTSVESDDYCWRADILRAIPAAVRFLSCEPLLSGLPSLDLADIDWLIVGGESGHRCRPLNLDWVRELRDRRGDTAFYFKQVGGNTPKAGGRILDGRTWDEFPAAGAKLINA